MAARWLVTRAALFCGLGELSEFRFFLSIGILMYLCSFLVLIAAHLSGLWLSAMCKSGLRKRGLRTRNLRLHSPVLYVTLDTNTVLGRSMNGERKKLLGARLKAARAGAGQSQDHAAGGLGVTRQSVSAWETGASCPSATQLAELSALYCVCAHTLLFGEAYRPLDVAAMMPGRAVVTQA